MNKTRSVSLVWIFVFVAFIFMPGCNLNKESSNQLETNVESEPVQQVVQPKLSANKKAIVAGEQRLLEVNHSSIMNYFKAEGKLCDAYYLNQPERKAFCTDKNIFKQKTQFNPISLSIDQTAIGFSLTAEVMSPDAVVGIFYPNRKEVSIHFLSKYYLGNEFLSFAPDGKHFIYQHNCWEGFCGLTVKNTSTLQTVLEINNPESVDERHEKTVFEKWIDNQTISYLADGKPAKSNF